MLARPMPFEEYAAIDAISQSQLKHILVSPLRFKNQLTTERRETKALRFGRAVDVAAFEPHRFAHEFVIKPDIDRRTKAGKEEWAAFVELSGDKSILDEEEHDRAWRCGEIIRSHPLTAPYFKSGKVQVVLEWTDAATGVKCKARVDLASDFGPTLIDLKTARSIDSYMFGAAVSRYLYHFQGAFYRMGWRAMFGESLPFKFAAVESSGDFDVGLFGLDGEALGRGADLVNRALETYAACREVDRWPGRYRYEETIELPAYAMGIGDEPEAVEDGPITY